MAPHDSSSTSPPESADERQSLYIVRHGDRWDYENPEWVKTTTRPGDPPLSRLGHQQARETGIFLDSILAEDNVSLDNITFLSSPFLRTIQTTHEIIQALDKVPKLPSKTQLQDVQILPEYSVFEWDGKGGEWHKSLPPMQERAHYFPRLNVQHPSLFVPEIPEPRSEFHNRCERAMEALSTQYPYQPGTALVVVTHAAACIGLCRAAARGRLSDVTPAAPCSVYRLTRQSNATPAVWEMDAHDDDEGSILNLNGHTDHLSDLGNKTVPWNNFGDKSIHRGYTGPPTSRFAPAEVRDEL